MQAWKIVLQKKAAWKIGFYKRNSKPERLNQQTKKPERLSLQPAINAQKKNLSQRKIKYHNIRYYVVLVKHSVN